MKKSDLKVVIKQLVRESMAEIFAEMHLETIVENVVSKKSATSERVSEARPAQVAQKRSDRSRLMENLGVKDEEWRSIYGDIAEDNPIVTGQEGGRMDMSELVSESALEDAGLMKDYSRFVK